MSRFAVLAFTQYNNNFQLTNTPTLQQIIFLTKKDILLESRQQYTLYGILLYVIATIFVVYLATNGNELDATIWNSFFWVIQLFICVNAVAKSFLQEGKGRMLYFYAIAGARDFIVAKLLFNLLLMCVMSSISLAVFALLLGNPLQYFFTFLCATLLGGAGLSLVFTFLAAIAGKAEQSTALVAIMGFPIVIPELLLLMKITNTAFADVLQTGYWQLFFSLVGLDILVIALAVILFPFLWKN